MQKSNAIKLRQGKLQKQMIEQLGKIPIVQVACERIGIGRQTYYR